MMRNITFHEDIKKGYGSRIYANAEILTANRDIKIGKKCTICDFAFVGARKLVMEDGSQIGIHAIIGGGGDVTLKAMSVVGNAAQVLPASDSPEALWMCEAAPPETRKVKRGKITLGVGSYLAAQTVVCISERDNDIYVGDFSIAGAFSYVDRSMPAMSVGWGQPWRFKKYRDIKLPPKVDLETAIRQSLPSYNWSNKKEVEKHE